MKKTVISFLLTLVMILGVWQVTAFADIIGDYQPTLADDLLNLGMLFLFVSAAIIVIAVIVWLIKDSKE